MKLLSSFLIFLFCHIGHAEHSYETPARSVTLSTAYAEKLTNSNEGLVDAPLTIIEGYGALFDVATRSFNHHWGARLAISLVELPTLSYWLANSVFVPYHEFGHAHAAKAFGDSYNYTSTAFGGTTQGISNYWGLSALRLLTPPFFWPGNGIASTHYLRGTRKSNTRLSEHWGKGSENLIITAAGLNNQSYLAKRIAEKIYAHPGHITEFSHYMGNKLSGWVYSLMDKNSAKLSKVSSDIGNILNSYQSKSINVSHKNLEFQSLLSLLSGTTYSFLKGYYDYVAHGDARVYAAELYGVRIPDINSYINARGLSLELVSGYRYSKNLYFDLAYEFVWKGERTHQVTPSVHYNFATIWPKANSLWAHLDVILAKGVGGNLGVEWMPYEQVNPTFGQRFSYFASAQLYNGLSLYGERNLSSISPTSVLGFNGFVGVKLNY